MVNYSLTIRRRPPPTRTSRSSRPLLGGELTTDFKLLRRSTSPYTSSVHLLSFQFEPEDEWHGKLIATVSASGFAGQGAAWFGTDELRRFAESASAYPLREEALPSIAGGFWREGVGESEVPEQVHLSVAIAPHDARGAVRVTVRLASQVWDSETIDLACGVTVRFKATYGDLDRFAASFMALVEGRSVAADLRSSPS
jgi:hypothetical protein